ncbi:MAG TPA: ring-cleaving dioxygenase [Chthonomonadaceae bacterium]|nr:ring-cleaving dioxygenase [Chthonomonadaceae bacterium]
MSSISGIHHITAICGDAQENLDFYAGVLGMRLVKRSVNQDSPGTYHLFYADAEGRPGTDLTFFPWPEMGPGRRGVGKATEISLAVPSGSLGYWSDRLGSAGAALRPTEVRRGWNTLPLSDPHGLPIALVEAEDRPGFSPWERTDVPAERQARGLHSLRALVPSLAATERFVIDTLGFAAQGVEEQWHGYGPDAGGSGRLIEVAEAPGVQRGEWGVGSMHHVAWRVPDDAAELAMRQRVAAAGRHPTEVIDRFWFKSVYFQEPGGVLFELATDGPGFAVDEDPGKLGETLVLPPWLEPHRREIEAALPPIELPDFTGVPR